MMTASRSSTSSGWRWFQLSLRTLFVLFIICPMIAWWQWRRQSEMEVIVTSPPNAAPAWHTGPWPPKEYYRREVRTVRRNLRNEPIRHGPTIVYDRRGQKAEIEHWVDDRLDGPYRTWHPDGQRWIEGQFREGEMDGTWRQWDAEGQPASDRHYDRGVPTGTWVDYRRGIVARETEYENGIRRRLTSPRPTGTRIEVFDNDEKVELREVWNADRTVKLQYWTYRNGMMHGKQTVKHASGVTHFEFEYQQGFPVGVWNWWDEQGEVVRTVEFRDGKLIRIGAEPLPLAPIVPLTSVVAVMNQTTNVDFLNAPLQEVVDYLSTIHEIRMGIDRRALAADGLQDIAITSKLFGVPLGPALQITLHPIGLMYDYRFEQVWITTISDHANRIDTTGVPSLMANAEAALVQVLREKSSLDYIGAPLADVLDSFRADHELALVLDPGLEQQVLDAPDRYHVTLRAIGLSVSAALGMLLDQQGLTCTKDGERILIRVPPQK